MAACTRDIQAVLSGIHVFCKKGSTLEIVGLGTFTHAKDAQAKVRFEGQALEDGDDERAVT